MIIIKKKEKKPELIPSRNKYAAIYVNQTYNSFVFFYIDCLIQDGAKNSFPYLAVTEFINILCKDKLRASAVSEKPY